jgi:hypothetical protein
MVPSYGAGDLARLKARDPQRWQAIQCAEEAMARAAALVLKGEMTLLAWLERVEAWRAAWMSGLEALHQAAAQSRVRIPYQRVWYDFDVPDGAYTPEMLREARKVVKPWGPIRDDPLEGRHRVSALASTDSDGGRAQT